MKNFASLPCYFILLVLLLLSTASCGILKHVTKDKETTDSTVHQTDVRVEKKVADITIEEKQVIKSKGMVISAPDSLHSSFSYDPKRKDTVRVSVQSGKLKGTLLLHPDEGTGDLFFLKDSEAIPVDEYKEVNTKATYHGGDTSTHTATNDTAVKKTKDHSDKNVRNNVITGLLLALGVLLLLLFFLARRFKKEAL